MYKHVIKTLLFLFFSPERAHYLAMGVLSAVCKVPGMRLMMRNLFSFYHPVLARNVFGLQFSNPVGLAAGFDKDARWVDELEVLGFGFVEVGTLTPRPQPGNEKPRLFRLPSDQALINRMGFNNGGVEQAAQRLAKRKSKIMVGGNIGKNKATPNEDALSDYLFCFRTLFDVVDYFVVNVSSPNTPGLRELQEKEPLMKILSELQAENLRRNNPKPILLKIAPDLTDAQLDDIIEIVLQTNIAGVIATNTTVSRSQLRTPKDQLEQIGAGGLSGKPLEERSTQVIRYLKEKSNGKVRVIGVGGIHDAIGAQKKLAAGADLIQVYTGFVYEGPSIAKNINKGIVKFITL